jgi:hypothetical protein
MFRRFLVADSWQPSPRPAAGVVPARAGRPGERLGDAWISSSYPQEGGEFKIELSPEVKLEARLPCLTLSVSGVDITSASVFTFRGHGVRSRSRATGTVGALAFRNQ